jgi:endonuclease/exonuclease/phosphatase family metal-dependent hydrolase
MRLATFNIFWLGNEEFVSKPESGGEARTAADWELIGRVIAKLNADVIAFQEIVSLDELRTVLNHVNLPRNYQFFDDEGQMLGTGGSQAQKVVVAYDRQRYTLDKASPILGHNRRLPFALRLERNTGGGRMMVIGVHFKSGQPLFTNQDSSDIRAEQCQHLADWIAGQKADDNPVLPRPDPDERIVILGDFNALRSSDNPNFQGVVASLDPLRQGHMAGWAWDDPRPDPDWGGSSTSYIERLLIDHVMLSPSIKAADVRQEPTIYAYDNDPEFSSAEVRYRVSDHRPVSVEVAD